MIILQRHRSQISSELSHSAFLEHSQPHLKQRQARRLSCGRTESTPSTHARQSYELSGSHVHYYRACRLLIFRPSSASTFECSSFWVDDVAGRCTTLLPVPEHLHDPRRCQTCNLPQPSLNHRMYRLESTTMISRDRLSKLSPVTIE